MDHTKSTISCLKYCRGNYRLSIKKNWNVPIFCSLSKIYHRILKSRQAVGVTQWGHRSLNKCFKPFTCSKWSWLTICPMYNDNQWCKYQRTYVRYVWIIVVYLHAQLYTLIVPKLDYQVVYLSVRNQLLSKSLDDLW